MEEKNYKQENIMTRIQALLLSIAKYQWYADNPGKTPPSGSIMHRCALCDNSKGPCRTCVMYGYWPMAKGLTSTCDEDFTAWGTWDDLEHDHKNSYDRTFFSLLHVEAFEQRLREVYKGAK